MFWVGSWPPLPDWYWSAWYRGWSGRIGDLRDERLVGYVGDPSTIQSIGRSDFATVRARHGAEKTAHEVPFPDTWRSEGFCAIFGDLGGLMESATAVLPSWRGEPVWSGARLEFSGRLLV